MCRGHTTHPGTYLDYIAIALSEHSYDTQTTREDGLTSGEERAYGRDYQAVGCIAPNAVEYLKLENALAIYESIPGYTKYAVNLILFGKRTSTTFRRAEL